MAYWQAILRVFANLTGVLFRLRRMGSLASLISFRFCLTFRQFRFISSTCNNNILLQRYRTLNLTLQIQLTTQTCGSWKSYELKSIEPQTATRPSRTSLRRRFNTKGEALQKLITTVDCVHYQSNFICIFSRSVYFHILALFALGLQITESPLFILQGWCAWLIFFVGQQQYVS